MSLIMFNQSISVDRYFFRIAQSYGLLRLKSWNVFKKKTILINLFIY